MYSIEAVRKYKSLAQDANVLEDITEKLKEIAGTPGNHILPRGNYKVTETIFLSDNCTIQGGGNRETTLVLAGGVNANMFMSSSYGKKGQVNENIVIKNIRINGNQDAQSRPEGEKRVSFCNAIYLSNSKNCRFEDISFENVMQTALHLSLCNEIDVNGLIAAGLGWSGISTSGTSNINATNFYVYDSGNDHRHSAVHLDGGGMAYLQGTIEKCVGNGVMIDTNFSEFSGALIEVAASFCMRGISLIGSPESRVRSVAILNSKLDCNDIGVMISNSHEAFVLNSTFIDNSEYGVLFQGKVGGKDSIVKGSFFKGNGTDVGHLHESKGNLILNNTYFNRVLS